jgi:hypothetical protein
MNHDAIEHNCFAAMGSRSFHKEQERRRSALCVLLPSNTNLYNGSIEHERHEANNLYEQLERFALSAS